MNEQLLFLILTMCSNIPPDKTQAISTCQEYAAERSGARARGEELARIYLNKIPERVQVAVGTAAALATRRAVSIRLSNNFALDVNPDPVVVLRYTMEVP